MAETAEQALRNLRADLLADVYFRARQDVFSLEPRLDHASETLEAMRVGLLAVADFARTEHE